MDAADIPAKLRELSLCIEEVNKKFNGLMMREEGGQELRARIEALNKNQETVKKMFEKHKQGFFQVVSRIEEIKKEGDDVKERLNEFGETRESEITQEEDSVNREGFSGVAPSSSAISDDLELGLSTNIEGLKEKMRALMPSLSQSEGHQAANERLLEWANLGILDSDEEERD